MGGIPLSGLFCYLSLLSPPSPLSHLICAPFMSLSDPPPSATCVLKLQVDVTLPNYSSHVFKQQDVDYINLLLQEIFGGAQLIISGLSKTDYFTILSSYLG